MNGPADGGAGAAAGAVAHEVEQSEVRFGGTRIVYAVERTARQKTVGITVDGRGAVRLRAPAGVPLAQLDRMVHRKARWIVARQRQRAALAPLPGAREMVSGETFLYLGRQYRLRVVTAGAWADGGVGGVAAGGSSDDGGEGRIRLARGWLEASVDAALAGAARAARVRELVEGWYRGHAARRLPARVAAWAPRLAVSPADVLVRGQDKRWGSCDARGVLRLNWRIVQAPLRLQDYVVAHELAHLIEREHTRAFWSLLGQVMPDYEQRREALCLLGPHLVW